MATRLHSHHTKRKRDFCLWLSFSLSLFLFLSLSLYLTTTHTHKANVEKAGGDEVALAQYEEQVRLLFDTALRGLDYYHTYDMSFLRSVYIYTYIYIYVCI